MKIALIYDVNHIDTVHTDNDWVHTYYLTFILRYFSSDGYTYNEECNVAYAIRKEALLNMYNTENPIERVLNHMVRASKNEAPSSLSQTYDIFIPIRTFKFFNI